MVPPSLQVALCLCILTFSLTPAFAQHQITNQSSIHETEESTEPLTCYTDEAHAHKMATDPQYRKNFLETEAKIEAIIKNGIPSGTRSLYTIPIVVHVIHLGEAVGSANNISDANIYAALQGLNERYANVIGAGLDMEIDFCLATRDPNGCPTTGIIRVDGSAIPRYAQDGINFGSNDCGAEELDVKALSAWPVLDYYNVWVVNKVCTGNSGYAYYPSGDWWDGAVIAKNSMNYVSNTLAHELGHALNLRHTFDGDGDGTECPQNVNCAQQGDRVCDTPPHREDDCGVTNPCDTSSNWNNSRYNYMSYCSPARQNARFTPQQKIRVTAALQVSPRADLLISQACETPTEFDTSVFTSSSLPLCIGDTRVLTVDKPGGEFRIYSGPGSISDSLLTAVGQQGNIVVEYSLFDNGCELISRQVILAGRLQNTIITVTDDLLTTQNFMDTYQWVDCDNNFEPFDGSVADTFLAPYTGNFAVITTRDGCIDTSECVEVVLTGIDDISVSDFKVFPNPTSGQLNIEFDELFSDVHVDIIDLHGRVLKKTNLRNVSRVTMDVADFSPGVYVLAIVADGKRSLVRVIR